LEFNLLRNSKSIILFLISIQYIIKRNFTKYIILNIIGCFFHTSSILYLPLYFFLNKAIPRPLVFIIFLIGNVIFLLDIKWLKNILLLISNISDYRLFLLIQKYLENDYYSRGWGIGLGYFERLMFLLLVLFFQNKLMKISKNNIIFINLAFIYWLLYLYCSELYIIMRRIPMLFICSYWIIFPRIYGLISKQKKYIFILLLLIYSFWKLSLNNGINAMYETVFNHSNYYERSAVTKRITADAVRKAVN
jgi:hypothetical protein